MTVLAPGQRIADRYELERRIAVGGMGEVWEASDTRLCRSVAVKVLRPELSDDDEFLQRFRIEARTVASLDHSGIAAVHDYGEDDGPGSGHTAYLVMELVRGEPLSGLIARGPIQADDTLRILEQAALALQAAHERGFVHRDVKPGNILIRTDGLVKLTDFGIAKAADAMPVTRGGMVMGTAHYIAPEQARGAEAGPAGDVYSLGIVGYECLTGRRPFHGESALAVAMMQVHNEPPPLPDTVPLPARELIESVLVKDPALRYATGGELAAAVAAVRRGEALPPPRGQPRRRRPVPYARVASPSASLAEPDTAEPDTAEPDTAEPGTAKPVATEPSVAAPAEVPEPAPDPAEPSVSAAAQPVRVVARQPAGRHLRRPLTAPSTQPLRIQPRSGTRRTVLLVLFVLLTVAAVVLGIIVVRDGFSRSDADPPNQPTPGASAGTLTSREDDSRGRAASVGPNTADVTTELVR